jgi:hypothetical protein
MAYTTLAYVKTIGALNDEDDYNSWRFANQAEMDAAITDAIDLASAWVKRRMGAGPYAAILATDNELLFRRGEACAAMMFLLMNPKTRRVDGSHYALDTEGSERYEELIDNEWAGQVELVLGDFFQSGTTLQPYARPTLTMGGSVLRRNDPDILTPLQALEEVLAERRNVNLNPITFAGDF